MKGLTFKKGRVGDSLFAHSFFKSFIVFVVMIIMTTSSASAEVIDGLCYDLNYDTKTATLIPRIDNEKYYGDIIIPEKVKGTVYFEGKVPRIDSSGTGISYTSNIKVPAEYLQDYKKALGSDYLYISTWNPND